MLLSPIRSPIRSPLYSPLAKGGGGATAIPLASIFASGGMLKSVNYLDRQFQDSTGTTAVSANDNPVGLALGYAQWGGKTLAQIMATQAELMGPSFAGTWSAIAAGVSVLANAVTFAGVATGSMGATVTLANGSPYATTKALLVTVTVTDYVSGGVRVWHGSGYAGPFEANGVYTFVAPYPADTTLRVYAPTTGPTTTLKAVLSVKEIPGAHAFQTTTNFRPVYKTAENGYWFFDGGDDSWIDRFLLGQEGMLAFDGTPTGTSDVFLGAKDTTNGNGYLGNNASGVICGAVGSDGFSTIVDSTGADRSNTRILALLKWSATQNLVQLKVDNVLVYSGPKTGAVSTTVPIREGALNNNGTAGSFFAGKAKMFYAHNRFTTDAEDTAIYQQRII